MDILNKKVVLLTGGTGVFGKFIARELLQQNVHLIMLIRGKDNVEAKSRVQDLAELEGGGSMEVFRADLTQENLGLSEEDYESILKRVTHVLHSAASARFTLPIETARVYNVKTTEEILKFARKAPKLVRFGFVSTALVAGKRTGHIMEDELHHTSGFKNTYEETKYEAESLVQSFANEIPIVIFRPPLILPSKNDNFTTKRQTNALYLGMKLVINGDISFLPGNKKSFLDIVESRTTASKITKLMIKPDLHYTTYHITNGNYAPTVESILSIMEKKTGDRIFLEFYPSMEDYERRISKIPWYKFKAKHVHKRIASFISELAYPKLYDNRHLLEELNIDNLGQDPLDIVANIVNEDIWKSLA